MSSMGFAVQKSRNIFTIGIGKITLSFFLLLSSFPLFAQNPSTEISYCQDRLKDRSQVVGIPYVKSKVDIKSCVEDIFELFNPAIYNKEEVSFPDFDCGYDLWCGTKKKTRLMGLNFYAGAGTYVDYIAAEFSKEELQRLDTYVQSLPEGLEVSKEEQAQLSQESGLGLKIIVTNSYNNFSANDGMSLNSYKALKEILVDLTSHFIQSELMDLGFTAKNPTDKKVMKQLGNHYANSLAQCFEVSDGYEKIIHCMSELRTYAVLGIAQEVLDKIIEENFIEFVPVSLKNSFVDRFSEEFHVCSAIFVLNNLETDLASEKMKACVYSGILTAFNKVIDINIINNSKSSWNLNQSELLTIRENTLKTCGNEKLFNRPSHSSIYYNQLMKESPNSVKDKITACLPFVEEALVKELISLSIKKEKSVIEFYKGQTDEFAKKIINQFFPECLKTLEELGLEKAPQSCRNFLYTETVFEFSRDVMSQQVDEQLIKLFGKSEGNDQYKSQIIDLSQKAVASCRRTIKVKSLHEQTMTQVQLESEIVDCIRRAVVILGESILELVVPIEIQNHPYLQKYQVNIDRNKIKELQGQFGNCLNSHLMKSNNVLSFSEKVNPALESCELESYKLVLEFVLDNVLKDELTELGMSSEKAKAVIDHYRSKESGLYNLIERSKTKIELQENTDNAYNVIINDLAEDIIGDMIQKEVGRKLTAKELLRIKKIVTERFLNCIEQDEVQSCQRQVMPLAIESIIVIIFPREGAEKFNSQARSLLSKQQIETLNVREIFRKGLNTSMGRNLIRYVINEVSKGVSMGRIQTKEYFLEKVYEILSSDKNFIDKIMNYLIQPKLDAKKQSLGLLKIFVNNEMFVWNNLKDTKIGQEVVRDFKTLIRRLILIPGAQITQSNVNQIAIKVEEAAKALNREMNRTKSRNQNQNQNN